MRAAGCAIVAMIPPEDWTGLSIRVGRLPASGRRGMALGMRRKARHASKPENRPRFWGRHAVAAALANPEREVARLWATREAAAELDLPGSIPVTYADVADLGRMVPRDAPHQGVVAEVERLPERLLADLLDEAQDGRPLLVLDHVTDPHNVGAILRSAAAFGADGVVTTERHAPGETSALAKAAAGALDLVPLVRVGNLARGLADLKEAGYLCIGLDSQAGQDVDEVPVPDRRALVLGAEGAGMRRLTRDVCDVLVRIPMATRAYGGEAFDSLNVSNAAAIALFALTRPRALARR